MSVVAVEGIMENGVVRPAQPMGLADGTKVYIVVPEAQSRPLRVESPCLVHPEQAEDFRMDVSDD